jgi:hypothetical protein
LRYKGKKHDFLKFRIRLRKKNKTEPKRPKKEFSIEHTVPHEKKNKKKKKKTVTAFRLL